LEIKILEAFVLDWAFKRPNDFLTHQHGRFRIKNSIPKKLRRRKRKILRRLKINPIKGNIARRLPKRPCYRELANGSPQEPDSSGLVASKINSQQRLQTSQTSN